MITLWECNICEHNGVCQAINSQNYTCCHKSCPCTSVCSPPDAVFSLHCLSHHTDFYMSLQTTVPMIHCTDCTDTAECTDYTHTAESILTRFISLGLPLSDRRLLSSVYHSSSNSYIMKPFHVSSSSLSLVISCCLVLSCFLIS